jgi:hypothetical protein
MTPIDPMHPVDKMRSYLSKSSGFVLVVQVLIANMMQNDSKNRFKVFVMKY